MSRMRPAEQGQLGLLLGILSELPYQVLILLNFDFFRLYDLHVSRYQKFHEDAFITALGHTRYKDDQAHHSQNNRIPQWASLTHFRLLTVLKAHNTCLRNRDYILYIALNAFWGLLTVLFLRQLRATTDNMLHSSVRSNVLLSKEL